MADNPARPPVDLRYLLWDGTDPVDSFALGNGLQRQFRCLNLLDDSPAREEFVSRAAKGEPRLFRPVSKGTPVSEALLNRGMFELPLTFFDPVHHNAGDHRPHILQFSGHGIPGFMFADSVGVPFGMLMCASNPVEGSMSTFTFSPRPWDHDNTKLVIFSACRQLAGRPQQFRWSRAMRGTHKVHAILSYRGTATEPSTSAKINDAFIGKLAKGEPFVKAWENAHAERGLRQRWAALCYRSAVGDRLDEWAKTGALNSTPADGEEILYFDSDNTAGRVVKEPTRVLNCTPKFRSSPSAKPVYPAGLRAGDTVPPWTVLRPGTQLFLELAWVDSAAVFEDGDTVWLAALQVRPNYEGPFAIEHLFEIDLLPASRGEVIARGRVHDPKKKEWWSKPDNYTDLYEFQIKRAGMPWLAHDTAWNTLTIPVTIKGRPNDHLSVFYIMLRVARGKNEFGIPTEVSDGVTIADQSGLVDDFQFFVFVVLD